MCWTTKVLQLKTNIPSMAFSSMVRWIGHATYVNFIWQCDFDQHFVRVRINWKSCCSFRGSIVIGRMFNSHPTIILRSNIRGYSTPCGHGWSREICRELKPVWMLSSSVTKKRDGDTNDFHKTTWYLKRYYSFNKQKFMFNDQLYYYFSYWSQTLQRHIHTQNNKMKHIYKAIKFYGSFLLNLNIFLFFCRLSCGWWCNHLKI